MENTMEIQQSYDEVEFSRSPLGYCQHDHGFPVTSLWGGGGPPRVTPSRGWHRT